MNPFVQPIVRWFRSDARHFQVISQLAFLTYGILSLGWDHDAFNYAGAFAGSVGTQAFFILRGKAPLHSLKSALITTMGLSLLLKAVSPWIFFMAGVLSISQKFIFRIDGRHIWNPAAFGIILSILLTGSAWISPGQWGSAAILVFAIGTAGLAVLSRVRRLETGITFILTLAILEYSRTVLFLGWGHDVFLHRMSSGALWLFAFFMITDPMTIPLHRTARVIWSAAVAGCSFWITSFHFIPTAPIWVLVCATPLVPVINRLFNGTEFHWTPRLSGQLFAQNQRASDSKITIHSTSTTMKHTLSILLLAVASIATFKASAFCGFYVAKADATLFNNKSEVILVRDGLRTVITMSNDFKGDVRDFAMVVPVPVVLAEHQIRVVNRRVFDALDAYSAPRLVEYYDPEPCMRYLYDSVIEKSVGTTRNIPLSMSSQEATQKGVTIEASYTIGEYDILILSAKESTGLRDWLLDNGYKIPVTADEVLQPYIRSNTKFFVVKVNLERLLASGFDYLNPIQIEFEHEKFMLPIRLGMANSSGTQDMIVYAFTRTGRVECTNYRTVKVPTDRGIPLFIRPEFGGFYRSVFEKAWRQEGKNALFLEYAWNVSPQQTGMKCDPCVGPPPIYDDFTAAGVWWAGRNNPGNVFFTRLHVRYGREQFPADLQFQVTPNAEHFQARYVLNNPAGGPFDCDESQVYLTRLRERRGLEVDELYALTGERETRGRDYMTEFDRFLKKPEHPKASNQSPVDPQPSRKKKGGPLPESQKSVIQPEDQGVLPRETSLPASADSEPNDRSVSAGASTHLLSFGLVAASLVLLVLSGIMRRHNH